ncbi:MAG: hypothetical protein A2176_10585 [Spirochaetes bacterium RBG_13_51_14]|nr:MAG: hypothetical protein A2176_10585 [Spirochaetes bacterium RBG_13_51_14]
MRTTPFTTISRFFLRNYDSADFILQQKVSILFRICMAMLLLMLPIYFIDSLIMKWGIDLQMAILLLFIVVISIMFIIRAGYFLLAAHSFLISCFIVIWFFFFINLDKGYYLERMASVVLVIALLSCIPLIVDRLKLSIIFYYVANILIFCVFMALIKDRAGIPGTTLLSYFLDTVIAFVASGAISYQIFTINRNALNRMKLAEEEIRKREELYRGVVEESPQAMIIVNQDGTLGFLSQAKDSAFGYRKNDIPTLDRWWDLAFPDGDYRELIKVEWTNIVSDAATAGSINSIEAKVFSKDGSPRDVMIRYAPLGASGRGLILLDDVTNRKIIERSLLASERRYRKLYDSMLDGFVSVDMNGKILEFNTAYQNMTGYSPTELYSLTVWDLTPARWHDVQKKIINDQVLSMGHSEIFEKEYIKKDGTVFPIELRVYLIQNDEGVNAGMWSIVHDITKRKKTETELLKASKIESLGVFAGGIAHDFNNLLTAVMGNISIAKLDMDSSSASYQLLRESEKASERAKDLTMQLLTFSKGGAPIKKITSIRDLLISTVDFVLRGSQIKSIFSIPDNLWNAEIDEGQISQVIHNLVLNAREAMPGGGLISIEAENLIITSKDSLPFETGHYIIIRITDSGYGIAARYLQKIFDPFFTTKENGNGLGLSVTFSIIKKHNGYITVDSAEGAGTCFTVFLPATEKKAVLKEGHPDGKMPDSGTVLLMDDEEMVLDVGQRILTRLGFAAVGARDGQEAIALYKKAKQSGRPFDFVIMDLTVPGGMGGKEAIKVLKEFDPGIKAIVSSGYSIDPVMANFREFGFTGVVAKPYTIEDLREVIRRIQWRE